MATKNPTVQFVETSAVKHTEWDRIITSHPDHTVYHLSSWHSVLENCFKGTILRFDILHNGHICGHWCGLIVKKYGMNIFGSPLPGTGTDYMHPLFKNEIFLPDFLNGLKNWAIKNNIAHIEIGGTYFNPETLKLFGFTTANTKTFRIDLSPGENEIWKNLKPAMRNKVRKAEKNGISVTVDHSEQFADLYYDMLKTVFNRKGLQPTYDLERVRKVLQYLKTEKRIIPLIAKNNSTPLSAIILLQDKNTLYFWGGASFQEAFKYGANDLIHWYAFKLAKKYDIQNYDTCGGGDYKKKFGGELIHIPSGYMSLNFFTGTARNFIKRVYRYKQRIGGFLANITNYSHDNN